MKEEVMKGQSTHVTQTTGTPRISRRLQKARTTRTPALIVLHKDVKEKERERRKYDRTIASYSHFFVHSLSISFYTPGGLAHQRTLSVTNCSHVGHR